MSKKMMKRSLALGALMAFVITGSAMAAELTINYENGNYSVVGTEIGGELSEVYSSLQEADIAGEMSPYVTKKNSNKTNVEPGKGLIGGTWTGTTVKAIGMFVDKYNGNKVSLNGGAYNGPYRIYGASNYDEGQEESTSNANGNVVNVQNVTMDFAESQYPGVTGGWSWNDANNNSITIEDSTLNKTLVYGGDAQFGDANNNTITVKNSTVGYINGGTTRYDGYDAIDNGKGNANNNKVFVDDSTVVNSFKGGSAGGYGNANGNYIEVTNLEFTGDAIDGGFAECGNVENNKIVINGDETKITGLVYGGRSQDKGNAIGNEVVINAGTFTNAGIGIAGGITENENTFDQGYEGDALQNIVTINGGTIDSKVHGGYSKKGAANENSVTINGGTINNKAYGGYGVTEANGNKIEIIEGTFGEDARLYGGSAYGDSKENIVNITNVTIKNNIIGGVAQNGGTLKGDAYKNSVTIEDSIIYGAIYGGDVAADHTDDGNANNNEVIIKNSKLFDSGQYREISHIYSGCNNGDGDANGNELTIIDSQLQEKMYLSAGYSGYGNANDNVLIINGSTTSINGLVWGGRAQIDGSANENKVIIKDGSITGKIYGGAANETYNAWYDEESVTANKNVVEIQGGTIDGTIYGGYAGKKTFTGYVSEADENSVTVSGGTVKGEVYGGYALVGTADNNLINISGTADVENASLYGSNKTDAIGNILNIKGGWSGKIGSAQNFSVINITEGANVSFKTALNNENVTVNVKNAIWNVDEVSKIDSANFDADSILQFVGEKFEENKSAYVINGKNTLTVEQGAKLQISGMKETTYNLATGFNQYDVNGWDVIADNALMSVSLNDATKDGYLQATLKADAGAMEESGATPVGSGEMLQELIQNGGNEVAAEFIQSVTSNGGNTAAANNALANAFQLAEAGGNSGTVVTVANNVSGATTGRLGFNGGEKGGHGVGLLAKDSGAAIWAQYVHGKDSVEDMPMSGGVASYEGQFNGVVMGVDFKKVGKFQSGVAFNYGEGDTNSVGNAVRTSSDYDFWGIGYYGNIRNEDTNFIFDVNYAKSDSEVEQVNNGTTLEANPETTTWSAGVKVEKLYQNNNVQVVPYTGLRFMSIDTDSYKATNGNDTLFNYAPERQNIWLLPLGVSVKQEVANDNGWVVTPKVDLSYIWAFGDTDNNMTVAIPGVSATSRLGYTVMDEESWLGVVGLEAAKGDWTFGVSYSYQKGDHSENEKWYVDAKYSF